MLVLLRCCRLLSGCDDDAAAVGCASSTCGPSAMSISSRSAQGMQDSLFSLHWSLKVVMHAFWQLLVAHDSRSVVQACLCPWSRWHAWLWCQTRQQPLGCSAAALLAMWPFQPLPPSSPIMCRPMSRSVSPLVSRLKPQNKCKLQASLQACACCCNQP